MQQQWKLRSSEQVVDRHRSHLHAGVAQYLSEVFGRIDSGKRSFFVSTIDLGRVVGRNSCVQVGEDDEIVFAQREGRKGLSRFVQNREPEPCSVVTVILKKGDNGEYILITAWVGLQAQPEPWDRNATEQSVAFWTKSALVFGSEPIVQGTLTTQCPW